jgi:hypothetical protein
MESFECMFCGKSISAGEKCDCMDNANEYDGGFMLENEKMCGCSPESTEELTREAIVVCCSENKLCYYNVKSQSIPVCVFDGICKYQTPQWITE